MSSSSVLTLWASLVCLLAFLIVLAIAYGYRSRGRGGYKKGTDQTEIFLSGENAPAEGERHIRSHNMYWGFFEAMKRYYDPTVRAHTGIVNDYLIWLLGVAAIAGAALFVAGLF